MTHGKRITASGLETTRTPTIFFLNRPYIYIYMRRKKLMTFYLPKKCGVNVGNVWVS